LTAIEDTEGIATVGKNHHRHSGTTPMLHLSAYPNCKQFLGLLPKPAPSTLSIDMNIRLVTASFNGLEMLTAQH